VNTTAVLHHASEGKESHAFDLDTRKTRKRLIVTVLDGRERKLVGGENFTGKVETELSGFSHLDLEQTPQSSLRATTHLLCILL
jgi:hypothetical protein